MAESTQRESELFTGAGNPDAPWDPSASVNSSAGSGTTTNSWPWGALGLTDRQSTTTTGGGRKIKTDPFANTGTFQDDSFSALRKMKASWPPSFNAVAAWEDESCAVGMTHNLHAVAACDLDMAWARFDALGIGRATTRAYKCMEQFETTRQRLALCRSATEDEVTSRNECLRGSISYPACLPRPPWCTYLGLRP